ncbi:MAG: hypothetical protein Q7K42_05525 [Candidatus Diapherotrites archaeon]|nr:hypothetical protein [Candidatus Diapherotrites archaeon]
MPTKRNIKPRQFQRKPETRTRGKNLLEQNKIPIRTPSVKQDKPKGYVPKILRRKKPYSKAELFHIYRSAISEMLNRLQSIERIINPEDHFPEMNLESHVHRCRKAIEGIREIEGPGSTREFILTEKYQFFERLYEEAFKKFKVEERRKLTPELQKLKNVSIRISQFRIPNRSAKTYKELLELVREAHEFLSPEIIGIVFPEKGKSPSPEIIKGVVQSYLGELLKDRISEHIIRVEEELIEHLRKFANKENGRIKEVVNSFTKKILKLGKGFGQRHLETFNELKPGRTQTEI